MLNWESKGARQNPTTTFVKRNHVDGQEKLIHAWVVTPANDADNRQQGAKGKREPKKPSDGKRNGEKRKKGRLKADKISGFTADNRTLQEAKQEREKGGTGTQGDRGLRDRKEGKEGKSK